tara:strand:- start:7031 stop:8686 length:1656 start_codon:yes stop_codon:yes gene_type:complete
MNAAELFVDALEKEGVNIIYAVPGEENLSFLEAIRKSSISLILTRHEQCAGFMASTYGRLTGNVGVCLATLGPGATNLLTAAAYAQLGAFPMLMITGQKPIKNSKQGLFQVINVIDLMRPVTKYTKQIVNVDKISSMVREAFRLAEEERPGACHLELPEDIAEEKINDNTLRALSKSITEAPIVSKSLITKAYEMIDKSKYPLLLIGAGANRLNNLDMSQSVTNFIETTGVYFFNTQMGKGVVNEYSSKFLGTAALSDNDYIHCAIEKSDLIINVGHDVIEKPPFFRGKNGKKVIHINTKSAEVDNVYFAELELIGDINHTIKSLGNKLGKLDKDFSYFKKIKAQLSKHIQEYANDTSFPIKPQRLVSEIQEVMPEDGIISLDNGIYKIWFARNYLAKKPNTILLDNALATMGAGLPSAMEAARLYPDKLVLSINGDGGFMMNSQELETAVRLNLNLIILILRDDAYGMIKWKQYSLGFEDYGLSFNNPDFVKYASSFGVKAYTLTAKDNLKSLIQDYHKQKGVCLIDIPVDYSENNKVLIDELRNKTCLL